MRQLWAPWRMAYIQDDGERPAGCIFCLKAAEDRDDENLIPASQYILFRAPQPVSL